jgi:hypothetical protein
VGLGGRLLGLRVGHSLRNLDLELTDCMDQGIRFVSERTASRPFLVIEIAEQAGAVIHLSFELCFGELALGLNAHLSGLYRNFLSSTL